MATKPTAKPTTVAQYLSQLPPDRRAALEAIRAVILKNLPKGYVEQIQYGMIGYAVPHSIYPLGYHCDPAQPLPFAGLASQSNHMGLYLFCNYINPDDDQRFREAWQAAGKKLDMGKACVRFKRLEDVPLEVIASTIRNAPLDKFIESYEASLPEAVKEKRAKQAAKLNAGASPPSPSSPSTKTKPAPTTKKPTTKSAAKKTTKKAAKKTTAKPAKKTTAKKSPAAKKKPATKRSKAG